MTAKDEVLKKIVVGHDDSRKLADATGYNQEYIRRVILTLEQDKLIKVTRAGRGNTYEVI